MAFATTGQSPDFLAGLLEITGDAVIAIDERYVITMWSKGAERLYGWTAAEMVGARSRRAVCSRWPSAAARSPPPAAGAAWCRYGGPTVHVSRSTPSARHCAARTASAWAT